MLGMAIFLSVLILPLVAISSRNFNRYESKFSIVRFAVLSSIAVAAIFLIAAAPTPRDKGSLGPLPICSNCGAIHK